MYIEAKELSKIYGEGEGEVIALNENPNPPAMLGRME